MQLKTPDVIIHNEMRMLQEAVDALLDNGRHGKPVTEARRTSVSASSIAGSSPTSVSTPGQATSLLMLIVRW